MRAIRARYDPYEQSRGRVEQLKGLGHSVDKVSTVGFRFCSLLTVLSRSNISVRLQVVRTTFLTLVSVMGGTFLSLPEDYRNQFVAQLHNSLSGWTGADVDEAVR